MIRRLYVDKFDALESHDDYMEVCAMVSGVGYEVLIPLRCFNALEEELESKSGVMVETHHQHNEKEEFLYGFSSIREYKLFSMFLEVSGVGSKTGMALVQGLTLAEVKKAVKEKNFGVFQKVNGVGKSTAEKIYISMKSQLGIK